MNIIINERKHTLEITKKFATAASRFGSDEYRELKDARTDFPAFKVVVKTTKSKSNFNGLTYEFMEKYIKSHDNAETNFADFMLLRGKSKEAEALEAESASYADIKDWFLATYPAFAAFQKKRDELLNKGKKNENEETKSEEKKTA